MLSRGDKYRKTLQGLLEYEWQQYPAYIKWMESHTLDEWINQTKWEHGSLYTIKRIEHVQNFVDAMDKVYNTAPDDLKKLIRIRYWSGEEITGWPETARGLGVSMQKAVRMNKAAIIKTADILGFWWDR